LPWLIPMYKWGLGGRLGNGKQYFPWIHVDDLVCCDKNDNNIRFNIYIPLNTSEEEVWPWMRI
jgi:NAD dependent epimerase/dehydratase family enzyme